MNKFGTLDTAAYVAYVLTDARRRPVPEGFPIRVRDHESLEEIATIATGEGGTWEIQCVAESIDIYVGYDKWFGPIKPSRQFGE